jgi:hypothetical protein
MPQINPAHCRLTPLRIPVPLFALDRLDEHFTASLQAFNEQCVQLHIKVHLDSGRRLVMNHESRRTELEVIACQEEEAGIYCLECRVVSLCEGAVRNDWRMPVNWPAQVEVSPGRNRYKARVRDVSVFGLGIELPFQPELGSLLTISMKDGVGFGRVKHCRKTARKVYFVGLYLEEFISNEQHSIHGDSPEERLSRSLRRLLSKVAQSITSTITRAVRTEA